MDSSRVLIAVVLSIVLVVAYQELVLKRFFPPPTQQQQQAAEQAKAAKLAQALGNGTATVESPTGAAAPGAVGSAPAAAKSGQQSVGDDAVDGGRCRKGPSKLIRDFYVAVFTTRGARLKSFMLRRYRQNGGQGQSALRDGAGPAGRASAARRGDDAWRARSSTTAI